MDHILASLQCDATIARRTTQDTRWNHDGMVDPFGRLYYIVSGSGYVAHHRRRFDMKPRHFFLIPANTVVSLHCPRRVEIRWCHFTATVLGGIDLFAYLSCDYEVGPRHTRAVPALHERLMQVCACRTPAEQTETRALLLQLMTPFVATAHERESDRTRKRVIVFKDALSYIDENIERPIRVGELASLVGYQTAYFSRTFKKAFGIGPAAYVIRKKIETAQRLMVETDGTLAFIAEKLSFTDAFHLSKTFKRVTGMTPREFRLRGRAGVP
jgi:AraC-like DNA-binding protein